MPSSQSKALSWTGRILTTLLILFFLFDAITKIIPNKHVIDFCIQIGIPEHLIMPIGVILLVSTLFYAIPTTALLGAILLTGYLGGAVFCDLRASAPAFNTAFAISFGILTWLAVFLREPRLRALIPFRRKNA